MKFLFGNRKGEKPEVEKAVKNPEAAAANDFELTAAIALAIRLYSYESYEKEETLATIQKAIRPYSPWNSKIYNMKQMPPRIITRRPIK